MDSILTAEQQSAYERDGYFTVRKLFDAEEIALMREAIETDPALRESFYDRRDKSGNATRMALWNHPGDSVYGLAARSRRVVDRMERMLGGEVYHYHSKLTAKEPEVGGAWEWHQDYGYWYYNGCLRDDMLSCMIALDRSDRHNGCLQIVQGSHKLGRIDHVPVSDKQNAADPKRMAWILERYPLVHCELDPGDVLIFHSNTLHRSDQNRSPNRRWTLLIAYNAVSNDALVREDDRSYVPLDKVDDGAIKRAGLRFANARDEHFAKAAFVPKVDAKAEAAVGAKG
jgi:ectoine hydroxylase